MTVPESGTMTDPSLVEARPPTGRSRGAGAVVLAALVLVLLIQHTARPWAAATSPPGAVLLEWLPNFIAALGLPFLWPAVGSRFRRPEWLPELAPEALVTTAILVVHELAQLWDPGHTFDPGDLLATGLGAALAVVAHGGTRPTGRRRGSGEHGTGVAGGVRESVP